MNTLTLRESILVVVGSVCFDKAILDILQDRLQRKWDDLANSRDSPRAERYVVTEGVSRVVSALPLETAIDAVESWVPAALDDIRSTLADIRMHFEATPRV
jgi:hypothetical protein